MESTVLGTAGETIELNSNLQHETSIRITEREVWEAANSLWAKKIDPSSNKVRELLGNRGSFRTIQMYLDTWRRQQIELPSAEDPIWQELIKMRKKYQQQSLNEAIKKIQAIEQFCEHKIIEAQELQRVSEQQNEALVNQLQDLNEKLMKLDNAYEILSKSFNEEEKKLYLSEQLNISLEKELNHFKIISEKIIADLTQNNEIEITNLKIQIKKTQENYDDKMKTLDEKYNEDRKIFHEQNIELLLKNQRLSQMLEQVKENGQALANQLELIKKENEHLQNIINDYQDEKQEFIKAKHQLENVTVVMDEKIKQLKSSNGELKIANINLQNTLLEQNKKIGNLEEKIITLTTISANVKGSKPENNS